MFQKGDLCKHFKGESLIEKNIYEILETGVTYSGDAENVGENLVVYRNIFQEGKVFAREEADLVKELSSEKQEQFHQKMRVEKLTEEEIKEIKTAEFQKAKKEYMEKKA